MWRLGRGSKARADDYLRTEPVFPAPDFFRALTILPSKFPSHSQRTLASLPTLAPIFRERTRARADPPRLFIGANCDSPRGLHHTRCIHLAVHPPTRAHAVSLFLSLSQKRDFSRKEKTNKRRLSFTNIASRDTLRNFATRLKHLDERCHVLRHIDAQTINAMR